MLSLRQKLFVIRQYFHLLYRNLGVISLKNDQEGFFCSGVIFVCVWRGVCVCVCMCVGFW